MAFTKLIKTILGPVVIRCLIVLVLPLSLYSQNSDDILLKKGEKIVYNDPDESIKIAEYLQKNEMSAQKQAKINLMGARAFYTKGNYTKAIDYAFKSDVLITNISDSLTTEILFLKASIAKDLHLYDQFSSYQEAISKLTGSNTLSERYPEIINVRLQIQHAELLIERQQYREALAVLKKLQKNNAKVLANEPFVKKQYVIAMAQALLYTEKPDEAESYFDLFFKSYSGGNLADMRAKSLMLSEQGVVYTRRGLFSRASDVLLEANKGAKTNGNIYQEETISSRLMENYLAQGDTENYLQWYKAFLQFTSEVEAKENEAVNLFYMNTNRNLEMRYEDSAAVKRKYTLFFLLFLFIVTVTFFIVFYTTRSKGKRAAEILSYIEVPNRLLVVKDEKKSARVKKFIIPHETEQNILKSLRKFEKSTKFTNKDMSLAALATLLDVNTKYLSEVVNKHYNENFNTYINKLRINFIIEKLKNEPEYLNYKISYLAEVSGFSSHSSFTTIFKSITNISPTDFISLISEQQFGKKK